ncbi:MAG: ABC transporter ATP-binding protein [Candidatus Eremiobacteraeota bacterium]|nr:ABC transporter ATP-binding protein [Candidatus Eremiobacteraeota bacterium]
MSYLEVRHLSKRFGRTNAVLDVSFELELGSVFGLAGPNGAGKSTLVRMLATIERPTKGQIVVDGLDAIRKASRVRRWIGYVPDIYGLYETTRVWEYLSFFARCYGIPLRLRQSTIAELLKLVDLYDFRFAYCTSLSRGLQQKLLIARALLNDPALLLLDEPLAGLDAQSRLEMLEVFRELASLGKAVFIASHHLADLVDVCDRVGLMAAGQLTAVGTVPELIRRLDVAERLRLVVLTEPEVAHRILLQTSSVADIEISHHSFSFVFHGGREGQAELLSQLVLGGVKVAQFAPVAQPLHEMVAGSSATPVSPDQTAS